MATKYYLNAECLYMNRKKVYRHAICVTRRVHGGSEIKVKKESQACNSSTVLKCVYVK